MSKLSTMNKSLLFLLILTMIGSFMAYRLVVRAYSDAFSYQVVS